MKVRMIARLLSIALLLVAGATPGAAADWTYDDVRRVVAVSDIHGAHEALVRTLREAAVIDEDLNWSAGEDHLVIVGDILDRGPDSRQTMDLLMRLEEQAATAAGRVHVLIGNHEVMNLTGDMRYVSREEYRAFAAEETPEMRDRWFEAWSEKHSRGDGTPEERRADFDKRFPPGFFALKQAYSPDGKYGRWLLSKPLTVVIDGTAFVHGGLSPMIADLGLEGINRRLREELLAYVDAVGDLVEAGVLLPTDTFYDHEKLANAAASSLPAGSPAAQAAAALPGLVDSAIHSLEGPLWYRGNVACSEIIEVEPLRQSLAALGADRVVIGHTPTYGRRVLERMDGRVVEIDTGMLSTHYQGSGHALVIAGGNLTVVGEDGATEANPSPHPRRVGQRASGLDAADIETLLRSGDIMPTGMDPSRRPLVSVTDGNQTIDAVFIESRRRGFFPDVAAYRLDTMLALDMVPAAVPREFNGDDGALRFIPAGVTDETRRRETGRGGSAQCPLPRQWAAMLVFDALIYNEGRTTSSIQYDPASWQLILADHAAAFGTSKGRPRHLADVELDIDAGWIAALQSLDEPGLNNRLQDVLDARRIRALLARRDDLLSAGTGKR